MRNLIKKILLEFDYEWAEEFIGDDSFYAKAMSIIPEKKHFSYRCLILFERKLDDNEAQILLDAIRSKGWSTSPATDESRINLIVSYSGYPTGYINLKERYISFGHSMDTYNEVNPIKWESVDKVKI
jgi:hypothetical protein